MPHTSPNMKLNLCIIESHEHIVRHLSINDVAQIPLFPYQLHVITLQLLTITHQLHVIIRVRVKNVAKTRVRV